METVKITRDMVERILKGTAGEFFRVTFIKRTDGVIRSMVARRGVIKYLKGGELSYDPDKKRLINCFDVENMGYRSIPLEGVLSIAANGYLYEVEG